MTQMESPKRKMQKKNDYQRHKLFRKIKRRRKAQAKADQQVAMKQLRKKLKLPKFGDYLQNFNYKNTDIYNYLNNLEVGKYIGAEPFDIQYDLPFHIQDHNKYTHHYYQANNERSEYCEPFIFFHKFSCFFP